MNFSLTQIPERTKQPRQYGLTMVMDKGLSLRDAESFISVGAPHTDIIKLGFGTSFVTPNLRAKIELYQQHNIPVYFGGTLFEAFVIRNQFDDYIAMLNKPGVIVDIKATNGLQDVYFVFKNPKAKPLEPIVSLKDIQFNQ